jgi:hypothetical protein
MTMGDWRKWDNHVARTAARFEYKTGPYRDHHRPECECVDCCGPELAKEIEEYNMSP